MHWYVFTGWFTIKFVIDWLIDIYIRWIHSFIPAISVAPLQVLYHSEALPTTARIGPTVSEFHAEARRQLQVKVLPKVPTWRLERESNPVQPTTLRLKVIVSTKAPHVPPYIFIAAILRGKKKFLVRDTLAQFLNLPRWRRNVGILVLARSQRNTDISLLFTRLITVYFQLPLRWKIIVLIKHHVGKKSINVWCPASIALKNDSSIYFNTENGFSLGPGKHKNAKMFNRCSLSCLCT